MNINVYTPGRIYTQKAFRKIFHIITKKEEEKKSPPSYFSPSLHHCFSIYILLLYVQLYSQFFGFIM